jgi:hypothetical protein
VKHDLGGSALRADVVLEDQAVEGCLEDDEDHR